MKDDTTRTASTATPPGLRVLPPPEGAVASATGFAETVRIVAGLARRGGLTSPVFRSPPRRAGVDRTIRRPPGSAAVVSVRLERRPAAAVQSDVIEGVVVANSLVGERADRFRRAAWGALDGGGRPGSQPGGRRSSGPGGQTSPRTHRVA